MTVAQEEIFGPVGVVIPFEGEEEAVAHRQRHSLRARRRPLAPGTDARVRDRPAAPRGDRHASTVAVAARSLWGPFGGYKQSGIGREYGDYGLLEYTPAQDRHVVGGTAVTALLHERGRESGAAMPAHDRAVP